MVKLVICVNKKPDMSTHEFHSYWREHHGNLYRTIPALSQYVKKYTQSHTIPAAYKDNAAPFDGIAELWFDKYEDIDALLNDPQYLDKVRPDEKKFCDFDRMVWFATEEESILSGA